MRLQLDGAVPIFLPEAVVHYRARNTMHGIVSQTRRWGEASALLQRRYDDGRPMIENRARSAIKGWKPVFLSLPSAYQRGPRAVPLERRLAGRSPLRQRATSPARDLMAERPDVELSIVVPSWNASATIGEQLEAIAAQEWDGTWEVVVADNGSTDDTLAVVEGFRERIPRLRLVDASDVRGAAHARNAGASASRGKALLFCDADDVVGEGWLAAMGEALRAHEFVSARLDPVALNAPWMQEYRRFTFTTELERASEPPHLLNAAGGLMGVRRTSHEAVGGFDESLLTMEDSDYAFRLQLAGAEPRFVPDAVVHYRCRDTIRGLFEQARSWGQGSALLDRRWGGGERRWASLLRGWKPIVLGLPRTYNKRRWQLAWVLGWQLGRIRGALLRAPPASDLGSADRVARSLAAPRP
jgi:glycosyltransferase involved in cell wall biosynthesis